MNNGKILLRKSYMLVILFSSCNNILKTRKAFNLVKHSLLFSKLLQAGLPSILGINCSLRTGIFIFLFLSIVYTKSNKEIKESNTKMLLSHIILDVQLTNKVNLRKILSQANNTSRNKLTTNYLPFSYINGCPGVLLFSTS